MSTPIALLLFATSLAATLTAAGLFARRLDRLGGRLGIHEAVLGLLTALAADAPELSSGITAMARGEGGVGVGVLLGSNVFNIAAMVGVSAVLSGGVALARPALALEGAFALFAVAVAGGVLYGALSPAVAVALLVVWTVPYLVLLARGTFHGPLPPAPRTPSAPIRWPGARAAAGRTAQVTALFVRELPAVGVIVLGSVGMVDSAVSLAGRYGMPKPLVGLLSWRRQRACRTPSPPSALASPAAARRSSPRRSTPTRSIWPAASCWHPPSSRSRTAGSCSTTPGCWPRPWRCSCLSAAAGAPGAWPARS